MTISATLGEGIVAVVPAAGVGKRMQADLPKQYLTIDNKTIIERTLRRLLAIEFIDHIVVAISADDDYFPFVLQNLNHNAKISTVIGGSERADSVFAGLLSDKVKCAEWVLVHDAARPCVLKSDVNQLIKHCLGSKQGAILAMKVRDTIKSDLTSKNETVDRNHLWQAFTPQMFRVQDLTSALKLAESERCVVTDEASAIEFLGLPYDLIPSCSHNIKITQPEDLALAEAILTMQEDN